jgi:hypothetical protein
MENEKTEKQENGKIEAPQENPPEAAIVVAPAPSIPAELLTLGQPEEILADAHRAATALMNVVNSDKSPAIINGKIFLKFEHWQTLGRFFGLTSGVEGTDYVEFGPKKDKKYGFKAAAYLLSGANDKVISRAESMCLTDEPKWARKPLFQISSMAQTRAQAKAFRNVLSFVVVMAGYEPTPAEEMENGQPVAVVHSFPPSGPDPVSVDPNNLVPALEASVKKATKKKAKGNKAANLRASKTMDELAKVWAGLTKEERQALSEVKDERKRELGAVCQ